MVAAKPQRALGEFETLPAVSLRIVRPTGDENEAVAPGRGTQRLGESGVKRDGAVQQGQRLEDIGFATSAGTCRSMLKPTNSASCITVRSPIIDRITRRQEKCIRTPNGLQDRGFSTQSTRSCLWRQRRRPGSSTVLSKT